MENHHRVGIQTLSKYVLDTAGPAPSEDVYPPPKHALTQLQTCQNKHAVIETVSEVQLIHAKIGFEYNDQ
jgi:hypothetical protein